MSIAKKFFSVAVLGSLAVVFNACGGGGGGGGTAASDDALREYLESAEMRSDLDNLAEFAYLSEYLQVAPIAYMSGSKGLFTDNVDKDEANEYADVIVKMISKVDQYEAAWLRIDSMQALVSETPNSLKKEVGFFVARRLARRSWRWLGNWTKTNGKSSLTVLSRIKKKGRQTI